MVLNESQKPVKIKITRKSGDGRVLRAMHLHVGLPKCGSSALQGFLRLHRATLLEHGIDYLSTIDRPIGNLTPFLMSLSTNQTIFKHSNPDFDLDTAGTTLRTALTESTSPQVILSGEGLNAAAQRVDLSFLWDGFDQVVVHLFLRPRVSWIASHYTQAVKTGKYTIDFPGFLASKTFEKNISKVMNFADHGSFWVNQLGRENVRFYFLGQGHGNTVEQFMEALELTGKVSLNMPKKNINASPSAFATCALASVQRPDQKTFLETSRQVRRVAARYDPFPKRGLVSPEMAHRITERYAQDTQRFLAMQTGITQADLEPDFSEVTRDAVSFDEIRATDAFSQLRDALLKRNIILP